MANCNITDQVVVSGHHAAFYSNDGKVKVYYALESPINVQGTIPTFAVKLDEVAADIATYGVPGEVRWNPKMINGTNQVQMQPLTPVTITVKGGSAEDVKSQLEAGGTTRVRRFVDVDGQTLLVDITQRITIPFI